MHCATFEYFGYWDIFITKNNMFAFLLQNNSVLMTQINVYTIHGDPEVKCKAVHVSVPLSEMITKFWVLLQIWNQ